ncbi:phospholipase D-like domain-containing protein [Deinococcus lacus]|uniref:Phospholipase D-like domain-containing protein n=1 Tax=Deinococcus lacus TaxID=392561 RepID=A0ABW1YFA3_9DEIO
MTRGLRPAGNAPLSQLGEPTTALGPLALAAVLGTGLSAALLMLALPALLGSLGQTQGFLLAFLALLAAYLCVSAGFALMGALSARHFPLARLGVRPVTGPYRFAVALGVTGGLLVIPALLLSVVGAAAQGGALGEALSRLEPVVFTLITALYGLLSGTLLGLLLLRWTLAWRTALAGSLGAALGGAALSLLLSLLPAAQLLQSSLGVLALLMTGLTLIHLGWSLATGWALERLTRTAQQPARLHATARQVWLTATLGLALLLSVSGGTRTLAEFVTARPVSTAPMTPPRPLSAPECPPPTDRLEQAAWQVYQRAERSDLSCGHQVRLLTMPGNPPGQPGPTAFDEVAGLVQQARSEVLFTTMEYSGGPGTPGRSLTDALGRLYRQVKADPAAYPQGMQVALTLGNYPVAEVFEWGAQVWTLLDDLNASGVPLSDPAVGWQLRLGNYEGTYPHSHVKLVVIDGTRLVTAGFNYTSIHLPPEQGVGLFDLALVTDGPAAQDGAAIFSDLWERSKEVSCTGSSSPATRENCRLEPAQPLSHPPAAQVARPAGDSQVISLYRRPGDTEANDALLALIGAAENRIDLLHVNFSMNLPCIFAVLNPKLCTERDQLPYMTALIDAVRRGLTVRLLTDPTFQMGGIENRIAVGYLRGVMAKEGIPAERLQVRLFPGRVHAKATLTDNVLTVGSLNMHYSSWTQGLVGLNEAVAATSDPATVADFEALFEGAWQQAEPMVLPLE